MQDKKLLGDELSPKSTINATTDMSQSAFLPKGFQFEAPKAPQRNYDVTLGDTAKAVGSGALRSLAGLGELSENFLGVGEGFRDLMSSGSDYLQESMTQDGRDALNSRLFEENENGNPTFAEGAADIDVWAMKIADGLGSLAANFAGGGFAGAGAKVALRSTITKSMLKKGMTEKAAQAVADKAISRMAATGAGATGVGTSLGGASMDARDAVMQMDSSWLADNSEYFQQSLLRLADDPQYQGMSATELFDLAKEETASYASLQMSTDPTAVAASVAGAMGDKYLFDALLGKMGKKGIVAGAAKGAITEGGTEFIEGYGQTYARNQVINEVTGQEIDPTTGALVDGLEGAVIGGALGGPIGAVGGYRAKGQLTENKPAQTNPQNVSDTQEQEIAEQAADDAQVMPNNGDAPAQTAAMNADEPVLNPQGQYDELLQGAQQRQADNGRDAAIRSRFAQSRQALTERGVLPERNPYQETIEMARAVDPIRAAEIEQFLKSEEADQNPELTAQLEREYESLAQKGRDLDIDPTLTQIEHRQNQNRLDMAKREKPHQRIERKQNEYQLDDTVSSRKAAIRAEMEPQLLKEDRNKPELLERMVELEYARRYPQPEKEKATGAQDDGLAQFKSARFDRDTALAAIEAKAQESKNAAQLAAAQRERDSRPASPDENPAWFGVHPESGERTTRAFMRDLANQKGQAQASERQADLDARRERLGQPLSSFVDRPNSMKMREQGKKPIRDFAGIAGKTSRMSKRLRKRLSRAKGFDTDAVLAEFQNHEKRLAAYEEAARRRADYEANLPENIERRKNAEALFKEFVSDTEARAFAENEITQTIKRINALVDASQQGSVLELDGQTSSLPVIKKQMAHSVRNLANKFVGKTAAMMNAAALKREANAPSTQVQDENATVQVEAKAQTDKYGIIPTVDKDIIDGVEHLGKAKDSDYMKKLGSDGYEFVLAVGDGIFDPKTTQYVRKNPSDYVTVQDPRGAYVLWQKPSKEINRETVEETGGNPEGVRNAPSTQLQDENASTDKLSDEDEGYVGKLRQTFRTSTTGANVINRGVFPNQKPYESLDDFITSVSASIFHGAHGREWRKHNDKVTPRELELGKVGYARYLEEGGKPFEEANADAVDTNTEPDIVQQAKELIRETVEKTGGSLKGIRNAYRTKGFTASDLQKALGGQDVSQFEREVKQALLEQPNGDKNKTSIENIQNELREEIDNNRQLGADNAPVFNNRYLQKMWGWEKNNRSFLSMQRVAQDRYLLDNSITEMMMGLPADSEITLSGDELNLIQRSISDALSSIRYVNDDYVRAFERLKSELDNLSITVQTDQKYGGLFDKAKMKIKVGDIGNIEAERVSISSFSSTTFSYNGGASNIGLSSSFRAVINDLVASHRSGAEKSATNGRKPLNSEVDFKRFERVETAEGDLLEILGQITYGTSDDALVTVGVNPDTLGSSKRRVSVGELRTLRQNNSNPTQSDLQLNQAIKGDSTNDNRGTTESQSNERSARQSEVQENEQRGTDANRSSVSEEDASAGRRANEPESALLDSGERSVSRDAIERLALDEVENLANGTATQRIAANIAAIRLMKDLTQSGMPATLEQKKVLAQYVGWGGLASVFDNTNTSKAQQAAHQELKTLLTEEEYNNVRMSTRNAFYTSEAVVKGMWSGVKALGLGNSPMNVVEPSLGSGNFIGWQPSDMRDQSRWFASELDPVTGNIAKLIYPEADVQVKGFQETPFKHGVFSLAIGNPPFGSQSIRDNKNPDISGMAIHNYFIAKSSKLLHENGLLMMVVTNRFLDTLNKNHKQLSQELDFVGAVRLPNTAFKSNAGTEVTTDIVVFRKLKLGETANNTVWTDVDGEVNGFRVNQWFAQNPQYILGEVAQGTMYRGDENESTVNPVSQHANLEQSISKALASLAQGQDLALTPETKDAIAGEVMLAESDLAIGGMMVNADGKVMRRGDDHPTNGAQVYEVTPDSIWSDDGWLMSRARHFVEQGDKARLQQFADNEFLNKGKIKSDFTGSKLKESAVKAVLAYLTGQQSKNQALNALDDAIDNTRLGPNKFRKLKAMLTIRNSALALLRAEKTGAGDIERLRQRLNVQYDEFAQAFATKGKNSKPATLTESLSLLDGDSGIEAGLDSVSDSGEVTKSDLFSKRLLFPYKRPESANNVSDAVNYSMRERGKVDIEYVSGLLGLGNDEVLAKLTEGEKPYLLMNPETQKYEFIDDYLSGNVKAKYQAAKSAGLDTNVKLLEAVIPEDKTPEQVKPSIRATWIDSDVFERFAEALGYKAKVNVNRHIGAISVLGEAGGTLSALGSQFKHARATLADLLNSAANGKSLVIYDTNGKERTKNEKATKEVNALANKLASTFVTWAKSDAQIAKQIADNFNERINTHVNRKYNGRLYLQTVGMNPAVDMRKTQLDGALRMIQSKNTLLDHTVGAGKTFTAITGMMERKRLGLSKKPMAVVPNHILGSFHKDILKLYPSAKVLVADDKAFTAKKRKQFFSRIATGDYDVVLMGHSHLRAMPNDIEHFRTVINEKIDELRSALEEAKAEAKQSGQRGATVKQIEDSISRLQDKIKEKEEALSKNADQIGFSFGDLGVDYLVVDEAHEFKNLTYATRTDRVVGMNDPKGSEKALDLLIKTRSIQGLENGGVTFMTGTPISNSLVEVYTMMYYLGHDTLKELKMSFYDAFAGSFFNTEITLEYTPTGTVKERSVLKGLNNMQQLSTLYRQFADVITPKDMVNIFRQDVEAKNKATGEDKATRFPIPNIKGGKRQLNIAPATEAQREYNDYLIARMEAFNQLKTKEERIAYAKIDNPLWVLTDAKKASLDVRLVDPTAQRDPTGKVARAAERIKSIYDQWQDDKGTQLVFSDMGTPAKYAVATVKSDLKSLAETVLGKGKAAAFISSRLEIYEGEMPYSQTLKELVDKVNAQAETGEIDADQYEKLEEQIRELTASTMTADTGFSVYDDLKASLMEKGIPDDEIAFIHDYNTTLKKEALFDRVRRGEVRVLIGSSMKMGAGTNVQNRLVALHHMDAPWRPSDMEQREGRIVRQGNEFYQRAANAGKPEGFEVELIAYTTQGSSDPVMWQILERKAGAIEQFRNGELDQFVENSNSDADSYAEFKAASTGNPIYRLKLESDAKLLDLDSSYTAQASSIGAAKRFVERFDDEKAAIELRLETLRQADITEFDAEAFTTLYRDAQADYLAADNEYDAAMAIYSELDAKTRKERGLKKPQKPKRPMINELDDEYSIELNKAIIQPAIAAVEQSRRWQGEIKLGKQLGLVMDVDFFTHEGTKTPLIDVRLVDGKGKTIDYMARGMQSSSIVQSPKLMNALHLNAIATALNGEQERFERKLQSLQSTLKDSRQIAKMDITALKQELDEAKSRNLWLSVEASMADIKEELRRSETPNKFVDRETLRKVKRSTFDPNSIRPEMVEHNGQRYQTVGVRIPYPGWQYDSVMPALDANGDYVHLLLSHNSKVGEAPVLSEVIPQPTQTPKAEYAFLAEAKARHEVRQIEEAKREIGSPVDEPSGGAAASDGVVLFSRTSTNAGRTGVKTGKIAGGITVKRSTIDAVTRTALGKLGLKDFTLRFETVDTEADLPDYVKTAIAKNDAQGEVYGLYDTKEHKVWLVAEKHNYASEVEETIFHEVAGHVGLARLLKEGKAQPDMNTLALRLGGIKGIQRLAEQNGVDLAPYLNSAQTLTKADAEEILVQELVAHLAEQQKFATPIQRLLAKVRAMLRSLFGFIYSPEFNNNELLTLVFKAKEQLKAPPPKDKVTRPENNTLFFSRSRSQGVPADTASRSNQMSADEALAQKQNALVSKIKQALYGAPVIGQSLDALGRNKYAMLTLRQMGEVSTVIDKPLGKMIDDYQDEINSMVVTQNMLAEEAAKMAEDLSDWAKANPKEADELFAFAHEATLADVDPSEAFQSREEELKESIAKQERILKEEGGLNSERGSKAWKTLQEERELLKQEPNRRKRHVELRPKFARLNAEQKRRYRQMRDHYRAQSERMNKALEENIVRAVFDAKIRKAMLAELRQRHERAAKGLYFPLSRHGDYWIDFADENGERQFMMFETKGEMELAAEKLRKAGFSLNSGMKAQFNAVQKASLPFVADVLQLVEQANMHTPAKESLSDEIYQMYLRTLPARSMRRNFIHRKGVAGFSQDAVRALADQGFKQSRQQARLDHMDILDNHLDSIQKYVHELPNNVEADRVVEELNKRHEWVRNPSRAGWAQKLTSLGFVWMLGLTPAAAMVNLTQNLQVALPILGSRYGMAESSKMMSQATAQYLKAAFTRNRPKGQGILGSVLTGGEKEAMRRAVAQGVIDVTQAADLAGLAENPNAKYSGTWNKAMNIIGWAFHHAEVFNREVTYIAAYRLAMKKHGDHEKAIADAIKDTWDSHFDYSSINRARFMQSDMAAVALQFKQYSQNMTYYLWANLAKVLKGETPEVKSMARKQLLGTLASTFFIGGTGALPLWAITTAIEAAQEIVGDDDEPFDAETELKRMLAEAFGKENAALIWHGALPSISGRISLNDLWVRSINHDVDASTAYVEYMKQALGPVLGGIGVSWAQGLSDISNDQFARGIERIPPKAIKDVLKTARYINEGGVTTKNGDEVVSDLTAFELLGQASGFAIGRANLQYDENNAIKNYETFIVKRRQSLMNAYYTAYRMKDGEAMKSVMVKIRKFNQSQYGKRNPITTESLRQSLKVRARKRSITQNGVQLNPKMNSLVMQYDYF
ncbi:TPA: PLxRFG domain-containing protein [Vibrio cholerae]|nr:PLxRFG domain-containing protein [Vibrio cholerae]MCU4193378.1 PLxRFG domain-containing protein [Vibrio cholerae]HCZ9569709.1 PLxRFG domain-containing protein [Vibrio cholerae]HCZ9578914.1 PLxRFG domain-containing protein [Vibrio cholerae]HCZ9586194.1 PLxRFG domain-containing protein [Vibrio cholerae]HCZ9612708.1 PLxRFG domain-containing protein [Vibrio cholerae]